MAISDTSIYNTYIARSLTSPSADSLSTNTISEEKKKEVYDLIQTAIEDNKGKIPNDLYGKVADLLSPYVAMNRSALIGLLRANNLFGVAETKTNGLRLKNERAVYAERYQKKSEEITKRTARSVSTAGTGGFLTDLANKLANLPVGEKPIMARTTVSGINPPEYEVESNDVTATGKFVSSVEELEYDMGSADRDISEIIVHWSETFTNANLTARELTSLTGNGDNAYHYIIKRDGSIERGVDIKRAGRHTPGHNSYSIGVCLVGGVNAATEDMGLNERKDASTITRSQYNSLYQVFRVFFTQYPGGQALGHSEIDGDQDDPGFEVRDYVYNLFNKQSLYVDPENEREKSPQEILSPQDPSGPNIVDKDTEVLDEKF